MKRNIKQALGIGQYQKFTDELVAHNRGSMKMPHIEDAMS